MAHRHDEARADEDMRLAEHDVILHQLRGARDHEQRVAIALDLGLLMRLRRVLDRQLMQVELARDPLQ